MRQGATGNERSSWGRLPKTYRVSPAPPPIDEAWAKPPSIDDVNSAVQSVYDTGTRPQVMDLALLEQLNEEYRSKPLAPQPPMRDQTSKEDRAKSRLLRVHAQIGLAGQRVLELGCGSGFETWYLSHQFGSETWGVDVTERATWASLRDERTHFLCADLATDRSLPANSFDRVISFTVFEHVVHPYSVLEELYRVMRPGGLAWISANLHRGPRASHLYRELFFPFPHLLFSDEVISQFREKHHGQSSGASWVNRLTWAQYEDYFRNIGFRLRSLRFMETPLDESMYERFGDILSRYPRWDLTRDFFYVVLEKPGTTAVRGRRETRGSAGQGGQGLPGIEQGLQAGDDELDATLEL